MRRTVRLFSAVGPTERLGRTIAALPAGVRRTLVEVAARDDLPLVAGSWHQDASGCLVANAVACVAASIGDVADERTLDLRMLDAFPEMSSRDLNALIVSWDEAAAQAAARTDVELRDLLRSALAWANSAARPPERGTPPPGDIGGGVCRPADATAGRLTQLI